MQTYDFTERTEMPQNAPNKTIDDLGDKFVTLEQFEALQSKLKALESKFEESAVVQVTKPNKSKNCHNGRNHPEPFIVIIKPYNSV